MNNVTVMALVFLLAGCASTSQKSADIADIQIVTIDAQAPVVSASEQVGEASPVLVPPGTCRVPKQSDCFEFVFPNASSEAVRELSGRSLWDSLVAGTLKSSMAGNTVVVLVYNPAVRMAPSGYSKNRTTESDPNRWVRTDRVPVEDVSVLYAETRVKDHLDVVPIAYAIRMAGEAPIGAVLQFPRAVFGPNTIVMVVPQGVEGQTIVTTPPEGKHLAIPNEDLMWLLRQARTVGTMVGTTWSTFVSVP